MYTTWAFPPLIVKRRTIRFRSQKVEYEIVETLYSSGKLVVNVMYVQS